MTTTRVVDNDILGKLTRVQLEVMRRVIEGTLDPAEVTAALQQIVEGRYLDFEIEEPPFQVSRRAYTVKVGRSQDPFSHARSLASPYLGGRNTAWQGLQDLPRQGPKKSTLRLGHVRESVQVGMLLDSIRSRGYHLADPWEFVSFLCKTGVVFEARKLMFVLTYVQHRGFVYPLQIEKTEVGSPGSEIGYGEINLTAEDGFPKHEHRQFVPSGRYLLFSVK